MSTFSLYLISVLNTWYLVLFLASSGDGQRIGQCNLYRFLLVPPVTSPRPHQTTKLRLDRERRAYLLLNLRIQCKKVVFFSFRRYLMDLESNYKHYTLFFILCFSCMHWYVRVIASKSQVLIHSVSRDTTPWLIARLLAQLVLFLSFFVKYCWWGQFLCSRKHGLKKPVSDRRQKLAFLRSSKNRLFNPRFLFLFFNWIRQSKTTEFFDPTCQSDSSIGSVWKSRRICTYEVRVSHSHATATRHTTSHHNIGDAGLSTSWAGQDANIMARLDFRDGFCESEPEILTRAFD